MKSYILAVALSVMLAAVYAFQNMADITVRFIVFQRNFPQGVWEVILFSFGALLMWFFSLLGSLEESSKHRRLIKEKDEKIASLEDEKASLLNAFKHLPQTGTGHDLVLTPEAPVETPSQLEYADVVEAKPSDPHSEDYLDLSDAADDSSDEGEKGTASI